MTLGDALSFNGMRLREGHGQVARSSQHTPLARSKKFGGASALEVQWWGRTLPSLSAKSSTRPGRSIRPSQSAQSLTTRHVVAPRSTPRVAVTGCETKIQSVESNSGSIAVESRTEWVGNGRNYYSQPSSDREVDCNYTNYVEDGSKCQNNQ